MGRGSVWERRVRLARREEEADPQRSVTDKQRRQRALPSQTLRAAGLSGLDCVGSGGTDRRRSAPPLTALPNPEFPSRRTPPHFQTGSKENPGSAGGARFESAELREAHGPDRRCRAIGCLLTPSAHRPVISADRVNCTASSGSTLLGQGPALRDEIRRRPLLPAPSPGLPAGADPLANPARFYRVLWIR
jgi:hypothetical protein